MSIFTIIEADFEAFWNEHLKPFLLEDAEPVLKIFVKQFSSVFGQQALAAAMGAVGDLVEGKGFGTVASDLATSLFNSAKQDAANEVNAIDINQILQTIQSALQVAKVANGIVAPGDTAIVAKISTANDNAAAATETAHETPAGNTSEEIGSNN